MKMFTLSIAFCLAFIGYVNARPHLFNRSNDACANGSCAASATIQVAPAPASAPTVGVPIQAQVGCAGATSTGCSGRASTGRAGRRAARQARRSGCQ